MYAEGWRRLWVVACITTGILALVAGFQIVPNSERIAEKYDKRLAQAHQYLAEIKERRFNTDAFSRDFYGEPARKETEAKILLMENRKKVELESLPAKQLRMRGVIFGAWVGVCIALYAIGAAVGWVYRGFRPKKV